MTRRQRISRALHWRLALHPAARSEFVDCRFSNHIPAGPDLSIPNLMLDRLADNLDIWGKRPGACRDQNKRELQERPSHAARQGVRRWRKRQSALLERAEWAGRWPGDYSTPAIRCRFTTCRARRRSRLLRVAHVLLNHP